MGAKIGANKEYLQKYERVKKLGFGGQANIWKVKLREGGKEGQFFAAKEWKGENDDFLIPPEVNCLRKMNHPYCLGYVETLGMSEDFTKAEAGSVIITQYVDGTRLREYIEEKFSKKTHDVKESLILMYKMAQAIQHMHCDCFLLHRDLHY